MRVEELLTVCEVLNIKNIKVVGNDIMASCCFHRDTRPSFGLNAEKECYHCFGCGESGTIVGLIAKCLNISYAEARIKLDEIIGEQAQKVEEVPLREYEEVPEQKERFVLSNSSLGAFQSGQIFHKYFIDRGFSQEDQQRFLFGWDAQKKRVTIPVFWEDGSLCGFIGRAVLNDKTPEYANVYGKAPKYYVYDNFPRSGILFPLNLFRPVNDSVILVEGVLDALWLRKHGYANTLAILTCSISEAQISLLRSFNIKKVILALDGDKAGQSGCKRIYDLCKDEFIFSIVNYPENCKDVQDMNKEQLDYMFNNLEMYPRLKLRKIE